MMSRLLAQYWWVLLIRGILAVVFGVLAYIQPAITLAALVLLFGAYSFADGVMSIVAGFAGRGEREHWWVLLLEGLVGVAVGILTLWAPGITAMALLFYIAAWAILTGILEIAAAIRLRKEIRGEWLLILGGLASVAFGGLLVARPGAGALTVVWLIAGYAVVFGILLIVLAFKARNFRTPYRA